MQKKILDYTNISIAWPWYQCIEHPRWI